MQLNNRLVRGVATSLVSVACIAYLVWKIDLHQTVEILRNARLDYFAGAIAIIIVAIGASAVRWQRLLRTGGVDEGLPWLTRTYYVSFAFAQVLPTSLGGDAARILSTTRRHPGRKEVVTGSVILERALGGAATLVLAAIGFVLAIGRYDVGAYLWIEAAIALATIVGAVVLFSRRARTRLAVFVPLLRTLRVERPLRIAYEGIHAFRTEGRVVLGAFTLTLVLQIFRVLAIWMIGKSVGVNLSPRPYYVLGPLLFLVMLVPFTINGVALREAFFVSFLGKLNVGADAAFATGFLFFLSALFSAVPGAVILGIEAFIPTRRPKEIRPDVRN